MRRPDRALDADRDYSISVTGVSPHVPDQELIKPRFHRRAEDLVEAIPVVVEIVERNPDDRAHPRPSSSLFEQLVDAKEKHAAASVRERTNVLAEIAFRSLS